MLTTRPARLLLLVGLLLSAAPAARADEPDPARADEQTLEAAGLKTDGEALLAFFRERTLGDSEKIKVEALIRQLGADSFRAREQATVRLIQRGPVILELLRAAVNNPDLEIASRVQKCVQKIRDGDHPPQVPAAAARLLRARKPAATVATLLAYLPFADNETVADEVRTTLSALAVRGGTPDPLLARALRDPQPVVRAAAGEALTRGGAAALKADVRQLLADPEPGVRLRVAMALARAGERGAVTAVIDLLPELSQVQAWQAEDLLLRLAQDHSPPSVSLGKDGPDRKKARDAWAAWWQDNRDKADLTRLGDRSALLGHTVVVLLDAGKVLELGQNNQVRWQVEQLSFPLDVDVLPGNRLLVCEYHASRVTERDQTGKVLWQKAVIGPLAAQRLANGNTFLVTDTQLLEVDRDDNRVFSFEFPNGDRIMKAAKLPDNDILCLTDGARVVRLSPAGKELKSFTVNLNKKLFGGRLYTTPAGRVLIPHNAENKVVEYDADGKAVWEVAVEEPIAATRLPNGNTLVTSMSQNRAVEFDRAGHEVWEFRSDTRVTRALRR